MQHTCNTHCNTPQHTLQHSCNTHCNTLQHTLQHTTTLTHQDSKVGRGPMWTWVRSLRIPINVTRTHAEVLVVFGGQSGNSVLVSLIKCCEGAVVWWQSSACILVSWMKCCEGSLLGGQGSIFVFNKMLWGCGGGGARLHLCLSFHPPPTDTNPPECVFGRKRTKCVQARHAGGAKLVELYVCMFVSFHPPPTDSNPPVRVFARKHRDKNFVHKKEMQGGQRYLTCACVYLCLYFCWNMHLHAHTHQHT